MVKKIVILLLFVLTLSGCWRVRGYVQRKKSHWNYISNKKKETKVNDHIFSISDTILKIHCCGRYGNTYWIYKIKGDTYIKRGSFDGSFGSEEETHKFQVSEEYPFNQGIALLNFINFNRIDTVKSRPTTEWYCDHCGGLSIRFYVNKDTLIVSYLKFMMLARGDSNHIMHQLSMKLLHSINDFEKQWNIIEPNKEVDWFLNRIREEKL